MLISELITYLKNLDDEVKGYDITVMDINYKHKDLSIKTNAMFGHVAITGIYVRDESPKPDKVKQKRIRNRNLVVND